MKFFDEKWLREHLPQDIRDEDLNFFMPLYLDGLKVMCPGERGGPDTVYYEAKDEDDLRWWELDQLCYNLGKIDTTKKWRWYRRSAKIGRRHWVYYIEHRHYDYNTIEDTNLPRFERYLRNVKHAFPDDYFKKKVEKYIDSMNRPYPSPHWGYDHENLCFIVIKDFDRPEEIKRFSIRLLVN